MPSHDPTQKTYLHRLLVVDDDSFIREGLVDSLSDEGYLVYSADCGEMGLELFQEHQPEITILDLKMPGMGGLGFLRQLQPSKQLAHSLIVLTGYGEYEATKTCYELGVQAFLSKPVNLFALKGLIKHTLKLLQYSEDLQQEIEAKEQAYDELKTALQAKEAAYQELARQHTFLQDTLDSMAEGVIVLDETLCVQRISVKARQLTGMDESKAIPQPITQVLGITETRSNREFHQHFQTRTKVTDLKTQIYAHDGSIIPVRMSLIPLEPEASGGWLMLFQDLREEERLIRQNARGIAFGRLISCDPQMAEIFNLIDRVASSAANVLVMGESGTGKELVAQEIHDRSKRAQGPFHAINCAAISPDLLESEFFGHERGSFTGAHQAKPGRFELAHHGTLFLDEVDEIPLSCQAKLLRALQEQTFERVGGTKPIRVDVRVIAATNQNLKQLVQQKKFREDLYYRLHVVPIRLPPLRERVQDIPLLISTFIDRLNSREDRRVRLVAPNALQKLLDYQWPGNVRELQHVIEFAFALSQENVLQIDHFPDDLREHSPAPTSFLSTNDAPVTAAEHDRQRILSALQQTGFHKIRAAELLGIHPATIYRKIKKYGLNG